MSKISQIKVGDKLYCKKTLFHEGVTFFVKGKIYHITEVNNYYIPEISNYFISILSDENVSIDFMTEIPSDDEYKFMDYFYTEKEHRKLKLKKLNGKSYL